MAYDSFLDVPDTKRNTFIKYLVMGGSLGALFGIFFFIMNNGQDLQSNPLAIEIIVASIIVIFVGLYLVNKSTLDFV